MKFDYFCLFFAAFFAVCYSRDIHVTNATELVDSMNVAQPGDHVIVAPGSYQINKMAYSSWFITASGSPNKDITLACAVEGLCRIADSIVLSNVSYMTITDFSIGIIMSYDAISLQDCNHITLNNLKITNGDDNNLHFLRSSYCTVKSCNFGISKNAIKLSQSSDITITSCTIGEFIDDYALYIDNSTKCEFSGNKITSGERSCSSGSWVVEYDAGGNLISGNDFGFTYSKYQKQLNGYLAKGTCLYGPTTLKNNFMDLQSGTGFAGCKDYKNKVCASNKIVGGATFTDGDIDKSC